MRNPLVSALERAGVRMSAFDKGFRIFRDGKFQGRVEAAGMLSALVLFGQENPDINPNAEWTVERDDA